MFARQNNSALIGRWPFYFAIFFTLLPLGAGPDGAAEGSILRQLVWGTIFLSAALVFIRQPSRFQSAIQALPLTFSLLLLYVFTSILWSPDPYVSFKRVVQVIGVVVLGASLVAGGNGTYRIHRLITPVLGFTMIFALAITAMFPSYAFSDLGYRAFMATKNIFGQFSVFAIIFSGAYFALEGKQKGLCVALLLSGVVGLGLTRSVTAAASLAAVLAFFLATWLMRRSSERTWQIMLGITLLTLTTMHLAGMLLGYRSIADILDFIFQLTGKDLTLSGRTYLWELMFNEIQKHPFFGTGYGGFWLGLGGMSGQIAYLVKWGYPGQAHNGYLDILNELGIVGIILLAIFLVQHIRNLMRLSAVDRQLARFHGALLVALLAMNVAEATILRTTHLWWIVFVASVFEVNAVLRCTATPLAKSAPQAVTPTNCSGKAI